MTNPPAALDGHRVVAYASVDPRTVSTARVEHVVGGEHLGNVLGLAICWVEPEGRAALMRCSDGWTVRTDTWHETIEEAMQQAEYEFGGLAWTRSST